MKNILAISRGILERKSVWILLLLFSLLARFLILKKVPENGDYVSFLEPWVRFIKEHGYANAFKYNFYNYTPLYLYFLLFIAKFQLNSLIAIKIFSILFELVGSFFIGKILQLRYKSDYIIWCAMALFSIIPSVFINSSYWAQCDSIYTAFIWISLFYLLIGKNCLSVIFLGIAFSLKLQTMIILPFYFWWMIKGNIKWYYFFSIGIIYFVSIIPTWITGRPISELLLIYLQQSSRYESLTSNFPNIYLLFNNQYYTFIKFAGLIIVLLITVFGSLFLAKRTFRTNTDANVFLIFYISVLLPFLLPGMHERYLYLGDGAALLFFLYFRKNLLYSLSIVSISLGSYMQCSQWKDNFPLWAFFILYSIILIMLTISIPRELKIRKE